MCLPAGIFLPRPLTCERIWALHTNGLGAQDKPAEAFEKWSYIIGENKKRQSKKQTPYASLIDFYRDDPKRSNMD